MRLFGGVRLTPHGLRPYINVRVFSLPLGGRRRRKPVRQATHKVTLIYYCSHCGHVVADASDKFCPHCGAVLQGINYDQVPRQDRP
jgi:ribosomal protein L33